MRLPRSLPVLALLLSAAPARPAPAPAKPDTPAVVCEVGQEDLRPQFSRRLPRGFKLLSSKKDRQLHRQELKLPDGVTVTAEIGGCDHLRYAFLIKTPGLTTRTVGAELVAISRRVLPRLPMDPKAIADPRLLLRALDEANIVGIPAQLPCGEATCQLALVPEPVKEKPTAKKGNPKGKKKPAREEPPPPPPVEIRAAPPAEVPEGPGLLVLSYDFPAKG